MTHWLSDPALAGLTLGTKEFFQAQRRMIARKPLIKRCYDLWYYTLLKDAESVPSERKGAIIELGSGLSYVKQIRPDVVTSDIEPGLADLALDARSLPFADGSVRAILLTHVFHHIPDVGRFLQEACRVLVPGGVISMVEVTHTPFARFFFSTFHPEPYDDRTRRWDFREGHTILDSNQALSWIVFQRDIVQFRTSFPLLAVEEWSYLPWLSYLLSGGVNLRSLVPPFLAPVFPVLDWALKPLDGLFAVHWHCRIRRLPSPLTRPPVIGESQP